MKQKEEKDSDLSLTAHSFYKPRHLSLPSSPGRVINMLSMDLENFHQRDYVIFHLDCKWQSSYLNPGVSGPRNTLDHYTTENEELYFWNGHTDVQDVS